MFQPQWNTPAGTIGSYASGATINFRFIAVSTSGAFNMRYYLQSGVLPPGTQLNTYTGVLSGTLGVYKTATTTQFTIRAIDGDGNLRDRTFYATTQADLPPNFVTPTGTLLTTNDCTWIYTTIPYTTSVSDPDVTITVLSGRLPPGLSLSTNGVLQGYCSLVTLSTSYTATLQISNSIGSNTRVYNIVVNPSVPRLPVILNSQPLSTNIPLTDPNYGYYRYSTVTQFVGAITTTPGIANFEGVVGCTVGYGSGNYISSGSNTISIARADGWVLPGTEIMQQLTGTPGGIGTYLLNTSQEVSAYNMYAINSSAGSHATFTGTVIGTTLTVTATISGVIGVGQKLYSPMAIYVDDIITDGVVSAVVTGVPGTNDLTLLPVGSAPYTLNGVYTLDKSIDFNGPITVLSNKLIINDYVTGQTLIRGDGVTGGTLLADSYIIDQYSGTPGGLGVYVLNDAQFSGYNALSVARNVLTVTSVVQGTISANRVVQTTAGIGVLLNTIIVEQMSPLLAGEVWGGIGRYTVSRAQNVAATTLLLDVDIGTYYYDDYFAFKIIGYDWSTGLVANYTYSATTLPPGLTLNTQTGWISGVPQGTGSRRYNFTVTVTNTLSVTSNQVTFGVTFTSNYISGIKWITTAALGTITNYHISTLSVEAQDISGLGTVLYRLIDGQLPPALQLSDNGLLVGRVEFNPADYRLIPGSTLQYVFTIQAYIVNYPNVITSNRTFTLTVYNKYNTAVDTVYLKCTPPIADRNILVASNNSLFNSSQLIVTTVIKTDSTSNTLRCKSTASLSIGSVIQFSGNLFGGVSSATSYYVISIPSANTIKISTSPTGREFSLTTDTGEMSITSTIIPQQLLYRANDPYFGINEQIRVDHIYGVNSAEIDAYTAAVQQQHYKRRFTLGEIKTAVARDTAGNIIYEVVYCRVIDNLVNNKGISVNYSIKWPTNVALDQTVIAYYSSLGDIYASWEYVADKDYYTSLIWAYRNILYPNSLQNMRTSLVGELGAQVDTSLMPAWMTSQQRDGSTLGYIPAWVICYTKPGASELIQKNIQQLWPYTMNLIDFEVDRVLVDKSITFNYVGSVDRWTSYPSGVLKPLTISSTTAPNAIYVSGFTDYWHVDLAFTISSSTGVAIGGLQVNTVYYVRSIDTSITPVRITVSKSLYGATEILTTDVLSGQILTAIPVNPGPVPIDSKDYAILYDKISIKEM